MRFTIINFTDQEKIKSLIDNLLTITRKRPVIVNQRESSIPNCDLIILPDEFRTFGEKVITERVLSSPIIKEVKNHIARGGAVLAINSGAEVLIDAKLVGAKIKRLNRHENATEIVAVEIKRNVNSPFLKMYKQKEIISLSSYSLRDYFILEPQYSNLINLNQVAFKYQFNKVQTEKIKIDPENTGIAGIVSENGNILCSIPDPTIFNINNEKVNDSKLFFENVVKTLS